MPGLILALNTSPGASWRDKHWASHQNPVLLLVDGEKRMIPKQKHGTEQALMLFSADI